MKQDEISQEKWHQLAVKFHEAMDEIIGPGQKSEVAITLAKVAFGVPCKAVLYEHDGCKEALYAELPLDLITVDAVDPEDDSGVVFTYRGDPEEDIEDVDYYAYLYGANTEQTNIDFVRECFDLFEEAKDLQKR